eukprot:Gb_02455 [translate_table: standard]
MAAVVSQGRLLMALVVVMTMIAAAGVGVEARIAFLYSHSSCDHSMVSLSPCLNYITNASLTSPPQSCCTALESVVNTTAVCLCPLFSNVNNPLGFPLNRKRALALASACNIETQSLATLCKAVAVGPATAPVASPGSSPASSPSTA